MCWSPFYSFGSDAWLRFALFCRFGIRGYQFGRCYFLYFFLSSIYYLPDSSMPWRVRVYVAPSLPFRSTHLIISVDIPQRHCANSTRHSSSWQPSCQYDIQGLLGADFIGWYVVCTRSQAGTLCESPTTRNVYGYVKFTSALKND